MTEFPKLESAGLKGARAVGRQQGELAPKIRLTKANLRAWLIATPMVVCPMWREYVDHMLGQFEDRT